jgi:hypothetical protein
LSSRDDAKLWRTAAVAALCAAAGSPAWGALVLGCKAEPCDPWTTWILRGATGVLIGSFFFEPMLRHLQVGRLPVLFQPRFRTVRAALRWVLVTVVAGLLAEAYRDGVFKTLDSVSEWGATSLIVGLVTYAWLRAIDTPYVEASNRAEWLGAVGALGFPLIGIAVDVYRTDPDDFVRELAAWIDQSVLQWSVRLVLWGIIGRLGVWIVTRSSPAGVVVRLMLAAIAAGGILEALIAVSLWFRPTMAGASFGASEGAVLLLYPFVTAFWCGGIWLATPRSFPEQTGASAAAQAAPLCPRISHGMRLAMLCVAVTVVALGARAIASRATASPVPVAYRDPRIGFFASNAPSPDPYGFHNMLTGAFPKDAGANRYVHVVVSVSHAPGQRSVPFTMACKLANSAPNSLVMARQVQLELPNAESSRGRFPLSSWVVSFGGPDYRWQSGSYKVECGLPRDVVRGEFTLH